MERRHSTLEKSESVAEADAGPSVLAATPASALAPDPNHLPSPRAASSGGDAAYLLTGEKQC